MPSLVTLNAMHSLQCNAWSGHLELDAFNLVTLNVMGNLNTMPSI
jgi:hypothetical protein